MATLNLNSEIEARVAAFSAELTELIQQAALDVVRQALDGSGGLTRRGPGRPRKTHGDIQEIARSGLGGVRSKGAKRDPEELVQLTESLLNHIKSNPGQRIEEIARSLDTTTKELNLPAKKLIATRKVKTKGQKRATQYFAR